MKNDWNTISIWRSNKNNLRLKALLENRPGAGDALLDILENAKIQYLTENDVIRMDARRESRATALYHFKRSVERN